MLSCAGAESSPKVLFWVPNRCFFGCRIGLQKVPNRVTKGCRSCVCVTPVPLGAVRLPFGRLGAVKFSVPGTHQ